MITNKQYGSALMIAAVVLFIVGFLYVQRSEEFLLSQTKVGPQGECVHTGPVCPYEQLNKLAVPKYASIFVLLALFASGAYLFLKKKPEEAAIAKAKKVAKYLGADEQKVFDAIANANGLVFQNELMDKLQLSKVKVTRLLDKLESKGLVERKRRGMTNIVVLKP